MLADAASRGLLSTLPQQVDSASWTVCDVSRALFGTVLIRRGR